MDGARICVQSTSGVKTSNVFGRGSADAVKHGGEHVELEKFMVRRRPMSSEPLS